MASGKRIEPEDTSEKLALTEQSLIEVLMNSEQMKGGQEKEKEKVKNMQIEEKEAVDAAFYHWLSSRRQRSSGFGRDSAGAAPERRASREKGRGS